VLESDSDSKSLLFGPLGWNSNLNFIMEPDASVFDVCCRHIKCETIDNDVNAFHMSKQM